MARICQHPRRAIRQKMARERQEKYDQLSLDDKIEQQKTFKGKQYKRLLALKEAEKQKNEVEILVTEQKITTSGKLTQEQKQARKTEHKKQVKNLNKGK